MIAENEKKFKKILYLTPRFTTVGAERLVLQYAQFFKNKNYQIAVASVVGGGELEKEFKKLGIEVFVSKNKSFSEWKKLKKFIQAFAPDIIHTHVFSADVVGYLFRHQACWLSTQHNTGQEYSITRKIVLGFILQRAKKVLAVSEAVYQYYQAKLKTGKVVLAKNGISLLDWNISQSILKGEIINLAIIGRLEPVKGHTILFQALAKLNYNNWFLYIFGAGSEEQKLKNLAKEIGIDKKIIWQGVSHDLANDLKKINIDVVILPSLWEGLSLTIMEAIAGGLLAIASQSAGEDLIKNKQTGLLFKTGDADDLREKINFVFENRDIAKNLAQAGREWAQHNFSLDNNLQIVSDIYQDITSS